MSPAAAFVLVALYATHSFQGIAPVKGFSDLAACQALAKTAPIDMVPKVWCIPADDWADGESGTIDANEVRR